MRTLRAGSLCDASGNIVHLYLASFGMRCELPLTPLSPVLSTVERLEIGGNPGLTGRGAATLAALFSAAPNMTHLHASYTSLSSLATPPRQTLAAAVCNALPQGLASIRLGSAGLEGTVPSCLLAHDLRELQLQNNELSGSLPPLPTRSGGASLQVLVVDNNTLSGAVPAEYAAAAANLTLFSASKNQLSGQLPSFAQDTLHAVRVDDNRLTGTVPASLAGLPGMDALELSRNALSGTLPDDFFTGVNLRDVSTRGNALTGTVPTAPMGAKVRYVDLSANLLSGSALSPALVRAPSLSYLYLEDNLLEGPLPLPTTPYLPAARVLHLARNRIGGTVPDDLSKIPVFTADALQIQTSSGPMVLVHLLDLSGNLLIGPAPAWLGNTRYAPYVRVNISDNRFDCPIPPLLEYMDLKCYTPKNDSVSMSMSRDSVASGGGILGAAGTDLDNSGGGGGGGGGGGDALSDLGSVAGAAALSAFLMVFVAGMVVVTTLWVRRRRLRESNMRRFTNLSTEMSTSFPGLPSRGGEAQRAPLHPGPVTSSGSRNGDGDAVELVDIEAVGAGDADGDVDAGAGPLRGAGRGMGGVRPLVRDRGAAGLASAPVAM